MYQVWSNFLNPGQIAHAGNRGHLSADLSGVKASIFLSAERSRQRICRKRRLSRGKLRGVGLVIVICFLIGSVLFLPLAPSM